MSRQAFAKYQGPTNVRNVTGLSTIFQNLSVAKRSRNKRVMTISLMPMLDKLASQEAPTWAFPARNWRCRTNLYPLNQSWRCETIRGKCAMSWVRLLASTLWHRSKRSYDDFQRSVDALIRFPILFHRQCNTFHHGEGQWMIKWLAEYKNERKGAFQRCTWILQSTTSFNVWRPNDQRASIMLQRTTAVLFCQDAVC